MGGEAPQLPLSRLKRQEDGSTYSQRAATTARRLRQEATAGERRLWQELRKLKLNIRRQAPIGDFIADFACHNARLVLEVDGYHHRTAEGLERDQRRDAWLQGRGYTVWRISDREAFENAVEVSNRVREHILKALPPRRGKGWDGGVSDGLTEGIGVAGIEAGRGFSEAHPANTPIPGPSPFEGEGGELGPEAQVMRVLSDVPDPEIPAVSVVDLGIVRGVEGDQVLVTPTYTGCPATLVIERSIREALDGAGFGHLKIRTVIDPAWTTDWISDEGRQKLRAYGIAPPPRGAAQRSLKAQATPCPRCGSENTEEVSRFGSTPCKAQWRCRDCAEPFDRFKCH